MAERWWAPSAASASVPVLEEPAAGVPLPRRSRAPGGVRQGLVVTRTAGEVSCVHTVCGVACINMQKKTVKVKRMAVQLNSVPACVCALKRNTIQGTKENTRSIQTMYMHTSHRI